MRPLTKAVECLRSGWASKRLLFHYSYSGESMRSMDASECCKAIGVSVEYHSFLRRTKNQTSLLNDVFISVFF